MGDIRVSDKVKSEVRPDMGRIRRLFQAVMQGFIVTQQGRFWSQWRFRTVTIRPCQAQEAEQGRETGTSRTPLEILRQYFVRGGDNGGVVL